MLRAGRPTVPPNALALDGLGMAELIGGHLVMAWVTKVARVAVLISAAESEGTDMIDDRGEHCPPVRIASLA